MLWYDLMKLVSVKCGSFPLRVKLVVLIKPFDKALGLAKLNFWLK